MKKIIITLAMVLACAAAFFIGRYFGLNQGYVRGNREVTAEALLEMRSRSMSQYLASTSTMPDGIKLQMLTTMSANSVVTDLQREKKMIEDPSYTFVRNRGSAEAIDPALPREKRIEIYSQWIEEWQEKRSGH